MPKKTSAAAILRKLKSLANPRNVEGMARFGIPTDHALGIPQPVLKKIAKEVGRNHAIASALWKSGIHEARCLAALRELTGTAVQARIRTARAT